jgi:hypothetical protein
MTRIESLLRQMTRAERLAKSALDALTVNRLASFAAQCGVELHGADCAEMMSTSVGFPVSRNDLCIRGEER